jgi:WD40 repeat protein
MSAHQTFASSKRPFVGLRPFAYADRDFFFGRDKELNVLESRIVRSRFLAVIGSSGTGKSSLIRAGLRPRVEIASGQQWRWVEMHPGEAPIQKLARCLAHLDDEDPGLEEAWADRLELLLRRSSFGIAEGISLFPALKGEQLFLLVDQFEELFRFADLRAERNHDSATAAEHRDEATAFVRLLLTAANSPESPIHVVVTMRSDFIGECSRFHGLSEAVSRNQFLVPGLTRDQRSDTIVGPVRRAGAQVDPGLIQRALNDTNEDPDQLPILQHAMMRCWEYARSGLVIDRAPHLTLDHYTRVGGVAKALSIHANEILGELTNSGIPTAMNLEQTTKRVFQALTETDMDGRVVRRPQALGNLVKYVAPEIENERENEQKQTVQLVISRFARSDCSFLRAPPPDDLHDDSIIDVGHEALIRRWDMLKGDGDTDWIREEQEDAEQYRAIVRTARTKGIVAGEDLPTIERWWSRRRPNRFWAKRYTKNNEDHFDDVIQLLRRSRTRMRELERQKLDAERAAREAREASLRAAAAEANARAARLAMGATLFAALGLALFFVYYYRAETARALALNFQSRMIASFANATLSPRNVNGAADALAIVLAEKRNLPDVTAYVQVLYRGLGDLREKRRIADLPTQVSGVSFAPRQSLLLAITSSPPQIEFFRSDDGELVDTLPVSGRWPFTARWSPDGERIYVGTNPVARIIIPCSHERLRQYFQACKGSASDISVQIGSNEQPAGPGVWSPDGKTILTGGFRAPARLWSASAGTSDPSFAKAVLSDQPTSSVAFSSDGSRIAIGTPSGEIRIVDAASTNLLKSLKPSRPELANPPFSVAFDPKDSNLLLATYPSPIARLWDIGTGRSTPLVHELGNAMQGTFDPRGGFIVTGSSDGVVRLWKLNAGSNPTPIILQGHLGPVFSVDVNSEGTIASSASDRTIRLWSEDAPLSPKRLPDASSLVFAPSNVRIKESTVFATGTNGAEFQVRLPRDFGDVVDATVSAEGRGIVILPRRGYPLLFLRDTPDTPMAALTGPDVEWTSVAFIEQDSHIAAKTSDGTVYIWPFIFDVHTLERIATKNLPLQGPKQITLPHSVHCRLVEQTSEDCESALMNVAHPPESASSAPGLPPDHP